MPQKPINVTHSRGEIFLNNLIGGIAWGIGATVGASLLLAILGLFLGQLNFVPIVGGFVSEVTKFVEQKNIR